MLEATVSRMTRREFVAGAAAMGATLAWGETRAWRSRERFDGAARPLRARRGLRRSASRQRAAVDARVGGRLAPRSCRSPSRWPRTPPSSASSASERTRALAEADHTCRVLVGGLRPARTYWYRFIGRDGHGSRIGRTRTAPAADDPRPVRFTFVSCQNVCEGAQNAYRRMIFEDERAAPDDAARLRAAPRRLRVRGRGLPGGRSRAATATTGACATPSATRTARRC